MQSHAEDEHAAIVSAAWGTAPLSTICIYHLKFKDKIKVKNICGGADREQKEQTCCCQFMPRMWSYIFF